MRLTLFYANLLQYKLLNTYLKKKTAAFPVIVISLLSCYYSVRRKIEEVSYSLRETDQYEDQSKDIFNWILKDEMSDSDSEALIEELWADEVLLLK